MNIEDSGGDLSRRKFLKAIGLAGAGAVVAACSSSKKGASATTSSAPNPTGGSASASTLAGIPANADGPATLNFLWRSFPTEEAVFKTMLANYQKTYPDIKVNQTYVAIDGYDQKVDLMTAGGQTPVVWDSLNQRTLRYYAARNQVVPLDDYVGSCSIPTTTRRRTWHCRNGTASSLRCRTKS
jgi:ABC-type glycerol-3-phosphate transport system substrate-binding protein